MFICLRFLNEEELVQWNALAIATLAMGEFDHAIQFGQLNCCQILSEVFESIFLLYIINQIYCNMHRRLAGI
jgi:hypothetical protein